MSHVPRTQGMPRPSSRGRETGSMLHWQVVHRAYAYLCKCTIRIEDEEKLPVHMLESSRRRFQDATAGHFVSHQPGSNHKHSKTKQRWGGKADAQLKDFLSLAASKWMLEYHQSLPHSCHSLLLFLHLWPIWGSMHGRQMKFSSSCNPLRSQKVYHHWSKTCFKMSLGA